MCCGDLCMENCHLPAGEGACARECCQSMSSVELNAILEMVQDVRKYFPEQQRIQQSSY